MAKLLRFCDETFFDLDQKNSSHQEHRNATVISQFCAVLVNIVKVHMGVMKHVGSLWNNKRILLSTGFIATINQESLLNINT